MRHAWVVLAIASLQGAEIDPEGLLPARLRQDPAARQITSLVSSGLDQAVALAARQPPPFDQVWTGYLKLRTGDPVGALRALRQAERRGLARETAKLEAVAYYAARQYKLFLQKIREAMEFEPDDASPHYYLGRHYESDLKDFAKAEQSFRQALERDAAHLPSHYHMGYCAEMQGHWDQAARHYRAAADLAAKSNPGYGLPWQGLARVELQLGRPETALPLARKAVDLGPRDVEAQRILARVCSTLGRVEEAIPAWERVAQSDTTDPAPQYQLFQLYQKRGDKEKSKAALEQFRVLQGLYGRQ
ncbi:MAG: tetratricopeptide repeat protein [Bryobacteraceae bacterium]